MNHNSLAMFSYIASVNPEAVIALLHSYGYSPENAVTERDFGVYLEDLVANNGDKAFMDLMNLHPDKDLILEVYAPDSTHKDMEHKSSNAGADMMCKKGHCDTNKHSGNMLGNMTTMHAALLGAGVLVALALISKN